MEAAAARVIHMMFRRCSALLAACSALLCGCAEPVQEVRTAVPEAIERIDERDFELEICRSRIAEVEQLEALPGTPKYDEQRAAIGRAAVEGEYDDLNKGVIKRGLNDYLER